jgi:hypothetical protein
MGSCRFWNSAVLPCGDRAPVADGCLQLPRWRSALGIPRRYSRYELATKSHVLSKPPAFLITHGISSHPIQGKSEWVCRLQQAKIGKLANLVGM